MKTKFLVNILLCLLIFRTTNVNAQQLWSSIEGPYGNTTVDRMISYDSTLFISSNCGIFKKSINQSDWEYQSNNNLSCYTLKGDSLFYFSPELKFTSLQNGNFNPIDIGNSFFHLYVISHSDSCLFGSNGFGFYKSSDFGLTWQNFSNGLPTDTSYSPWPPYINHTYRINGIATTTGFLFCATNYGVYKSDASLNLWTPLTNGIVATTIKGIYSSNDTLYAYTANNLYRSSDMGNTWSLLYQASSTINCVFNKNKTIWIGTSNNGIIYSNNNGSSWSSFNNGLTDLNIQTITLSNNALWCGSATNGTFNLIGAMWYNDRKGINCSFIRSLSSTDSELIANNGLTIAKLNAGNWTNCTPPMACDYWYKVIAHHDTIVASAEHNTNIWPYDNPFIVKSNDGGLTWDSLSNQPLFYSIDPYKILFEHSRIYIREVDKLFFTDNDGVNWINICVPNPGCVVMNDFIVHHEIPFISGCHPSQLLAFNNSTWNASANGLSAAGEPTFFAQCDNAVFNFVDNVGMYVSFDDGANWSYASAGLSGFNYVSDYAYNGSKLFISTDNGIFATYNYGQQWIALNDGIANKWVNSLYIFNDTLYAGTVGNGIWKMAIPSTLTSVSEIGAKKFELSIVPNPFNAITKISSTGLIGAGLIKICNSEGKLVAQEKISDISSFIWDGSKLPNGFYFAQIIQDNHIKAIGKMVIANER